MVLKDKIAIVTGAGRGIGRGIALRFAQEGADLAVVDIDREVAESVAQEIRQLGRRAWVDLADLSKVLDAQEMVQRAAKEFGRIDVLVNNAGMGNPKPLLEISEKDWNAVFDLNTRGLFFCLQEAARQMIRQGGQGKIINIASVAGKVGNTRHLHYAASKAAVISITYSAALALAPHRINVNAICPGIVDTRWWIEIDRVVTTAKGLPPGSEWKRIVDTIPFGRPAQPADIAASAAFLASADADYVTGQTINVNGGTRMD